MEETEIETLKPEVLEPPEIDTVPGQAEVRSVRVPVQEMIINGERRVQYGEAVALVCPKCGAAIRQFDMGASALDVLKSLNTDDESALMAKFHCPACGKPLRMMRPMPVDMRGDAE